MDTNIPNGREPLLQNFFIEKKQQPFVKNLTCSQDILPIHTNILHRLDYFLQTNKIPHIIFHGPSGSGKRTIVYDVKYIGMMCCNMIIWVFVTYKL